LTRRSLFENELAFLAYVVCNVVLYTLMTYFGLLVISFKRLVLKESSPPLPPDDLDNKTEASSYAHRRASFDYPFLTLKERDVETGLDYFLARYYSSAHGRFSSADPDNAQGKSNPGDPQGWNAYLYVCNNPLTRTDPDGRLMDGASEAWQRFRNWLYFERPVTDAQLKKEVEQKREELRNNLRAMDGHRYSPEEFDGMGTRQILLLYDRYRFGIDSGVGRPDPEQPPLVPGPVTNPTNVPKHVQDALKQIEQTR
jgi:RHS repeat-associated protein